MGRKRSDRFGEDTCNEQPFIAIAWLTGVKPRDFNSDFDSVDT